MNLKAVISCNLIALFFAGATQGAPVSGITNKASQLTNQPKLVVTNPAPAIVVTNQILDVATNTGPVFPDKVYTNSVEMEFVRVSSKVWAGKYEVTQEEFQKVMGGNPSQFPGKNNPVDSVSYDEAIEFCKRLTARELKEESLPKGFSYTLPTEDQWQELVAGASLADAVTSANGSRSGTSPVGTLKPNSLGLYDIRGNVSEFCLGESKPYRVLHGGSWKDSIEVNLRLVFRVYARPDQAQNTFGFRCLLVFDGKFPSGNGNQ